jgi:Flp pilus assembly pilin Flp
MNHEEVPMRELVHRLRRTLRPLAEAGQTTAEYALVILGVAVVAGGLAIWAKGGAIKNLFDDIIGKIL